MPIAVPQVQSPEPTKPTQRAPLRSSGSLDNYSSFDVTPSIGTEFREISKDNKEILLLEDVLNDEQKLRDLAVLISERGVVFFRGQEIKDDDERRLVDGLGKASGKPACSGLHIHPLTQESSEFGDEISVISSKYVFADKFQLPTKQHPSEKTRASRGWHADITFEHRPSDYAVLQIKQLPPVGGDTLWASAYEAYDRLSPTYQKFLEGLTATHSGDGFITHANAAGVKLRENRGSPKNVGQDLKAVHPVIRTNPVTGWKGIFVNRAFTRRINELSQEESDATLAYLYDHTAQNHDIQVRFRWEPNSVAIWDNRSTWHAITKDFEDEIIRVGHRAVSIGETPYFDPESVSRREGLRQRGEAV